MYVCVRAYVREKSSRYVWQCSTARVNKYLFFWLISVKNQWSGSACLISRWVSEREYRWDSEVTRGSAVCVMAVTGQYIFVSSLMACLTYWWSGILRVRIWSWTLSSDRQPPDDFILLNMGWRLVGWLIRSFPSLPPNKAEYRYYASARLFIW